MPLTTIFDEVMEGPGLDDPFPVYRRWREEAPVHPVVPGHWALTRHEDVAFVLRDPRFVVMPPGRIPVPVLKTLARMFKFLDPPDHRRLRQTVIAPFTPRPVERQRAFVEGVCAALLAGRSSLDVVADYAHRLPIATGGRVLGVPERDWDRTGRWAHGVMRAADSPTPRNLADVVRLWRAGERPPVMSLDAAAKLRRYARRLIRGRVRGAGLAAGGGDAGAALDGSAGGAGGAAGSPTLEGLRRAVADGTVSLDDAAATWMAMLLGGVVANRALVGNAVYTLLAHPEQLALLRSDPSLLPSAADEVLRFQGPGMQILRRAAADVVVGSTLVSAGDVVHLMLGAANRDPDAFADPDRFDIRRRPPVRHVGFGTGIHHCPGDHLSRLALEAALSAILPRLPDRLPDGFRPVWRRSFSVREITSLPLDLAPA